MPPRLRRRSCRAIACAASKLVLKTVSSRVLWPTKPPVLTSIVRHRFGLVDNQVSARLELHFFAKGFLNFVFDAVDIKNGALTGIVL